MSSTVAAIHHDRQPSLIDRIRAGNKQTPEASLDAWLTFVGVLDDGQPWELNALGVRNRQALWAENGIAYAWSRAEIHRLVRDSDPFQAEGVHLVPAVINPAIACRYSRDAWARSDSRASSKGGDVLHRRVLCFDFDPKRPRKVSASKEEMIAAIKTAAETVKVLIEMLGDESYLGFGFSGNGCQVHIAVDLVEQDGVEALYERILGAANKVFSRSIEKVFVEVDTTLINSDRMLPAFGSVKRKGGNHADRPHRRTWYVASETTRRLDLEGLREFAAKLEAMVPAELDAGYEDDVDPDDVSPGSTKRPRSNTTNRRDVLRECGSVSVSTVASLLGIDPAKPHCPDCGAKTGIDILESKGMNVLKCMHQSCGQRAWGSVDLVAHMVAGVDSLRGNGDAVRQVIEWFVANGLVSPPKPRAPKSASIEHFLRQSEVDYSAWTSQQLFEICDVVVVTDEEEAAWLAWIEGDTDRCPWDGASVPPPSKKVSHPLTDLGNAHRFADTCGHNVRFVRGWDRWILWSGSRWEPCSRHDVRLLAHEVIRNIVREVATAHEDDKMAIAKWALKSQDKRNLDACVELAKDLCLLDHTALDQDPWLLNVRNGTIELKTGIVREHRRDDYLTMMADVEHDPSASSAVWERHLSQVQPDIEVRDYLQRAWGYALTGVVKEHTLNVHWGSEGGNGKSCTLWTIAKLMGDYAISCSDELVMMKDSGHPTHRMSLFGKRFAVASETEKGGAMDVNAVKRLTGGDPITGRRMREDEWSYLPTHKLEIITNHRPVVNEPGNAIWRRLRLFTWDQVFEHRPGPSQEEKLWAARSGILNWLVEGCRLWQAKGLERPACIAASTDEYRGDADRVGQWIEDACVVGDDASAASRTLYKYYVEWMREGGYRPLSEAQLVEDLGRRGFKRARVQEGRQRVRKVVGVRLRIGDEDDGEGVALVDDPLDAVTYAMAMM